MITGDLLDSVEVLFWTKPRHLIERVVIQIKVTLFLSLSHS